ncbi:hypothetical protein GCM10025867_40230 [Frondihabitans sucicola]|uniref:ResB-like domain-containing protein n=1 Tax=Frondihabitans sucicola TaxID=1268041 RepID=A0ABM8GTI4_9MICO|nr:hypothetical protein GCM10025867_40230 [Frondihabitans sucicola]
MAPSSDDKNGRDRSTKNGVQSPPEAPDADRTDENADPLRPQDHIDYVPPTTAAGGAGGGDDGITQPRLGFFGYVRFFWRQLTSMRTALFLLMLLALAAVPGSLVPQTTSDPNGVAQYKADHPELYPILHKLGLFDTFSTPWFSAVYLLLFVSLIGCIIPRVKHHLEALRSAPPKTPARLTRLAGFQSHPLKHDLAGGRLPRPPRSRSAPPARSCGEPATAPRSTVTRSAPNAAISARRATSCSTSRFWVS